ncbi:MAG TPA: tRNA lysidine(34) synthetase TilS [Solirubrobacteraceae bacterium]|jgi:tRNA(Ile)-lysidine synthase
MTTVEDTRELVRAGGLLSGDGAVVAMLSGGRDSVCLLDIAVALCGAERVRALHVNYGLRAESGGDEALCRELCEALGVPLEVVRAAREPNAVGNLHAWARDLRYGAANELARRLDIASGVAVSAEGAAQGHAHGGARVAAGHTATDQVETILYRLAASPGRRALLGMPASEGRLVRPLLEITREQTAAYCTQRSLAWREDQSNDSPSYARARVRHGLVGALDAVHPAAQANVLRTAELLREETELLDALVDAELEGGSSVSIERLAELPPALARLVAIRLAEDVAGTFVPRAGERVGEILALAHRGGCAELHIGGLVGAVIEGGELRMVRIPSRTRG